MTPRPTMRDPMEPRSSEPAPRFVWIDGELRPADAAHVSSFDRGFQQGDGIFETLRARGGHVTELPQHVDRLRRSADGLSIALPSDIATRVAEGIDALLAAEELDRPGGDASIRITVSRGSWYERGLLPPAGREVPPTIVIQAWPVPPVPVGHLERGLALVASSIRRNPSNPLLSLKTTSRIDYVYARLEARRAGADDALFLTDSGHISEATSANIVLIRHGADGPVELATPALECAILAGTTRSWILRWAGDAGLRVVEGWLTPDELAAASEAFLCSSVAGVLPVTRFNDHPIGNGRPGPWTMRARAAREAFIRGD
jgi:branched-subunit amino acid aminotransferase/4-amino-4-deoxychorismate lyase